MLSQSAPVLVRPVGRSLRVLHVVQPTVAGMVPAVAALAADQDARGWEVVVASPPDPAFVAAVRHAGAHHRTWPATRAPGPATTGEVAALARLVRDVRPDVVHLHSSKAGLVGRLVVRGALPTLFTPHAWSFFAIDGAPRAAARAWERLGSRWVDTIVCVSADERRAGVDAGVTAPMVVISNGVDLARFRPADDDARARARVSLGLAAAAPTVVCVGRLCRQKGQDVLLEAWPAVRHAFPDAVVVLVGAGPASRSLARHASDGVRFAGDADDVRPWLAAAEVVAMPSRWEGLPYVLLEALAMRRPVVGTAVTGIAEVLGRAGGALVEPDDPAGLSAALVRRLASPAVAREEAARGRALVEARYDLRDQLEHTSQLTAQVAGEHHEHRGDPRWRR